MELKLGSLSLSLVALDLLVHLLEYLLHHVLSAANAAVDQRLKARSQAGGKSRQLLGGIVGQGGSWCAG